MVCIQRDLRDRLGQPQCPIHSRHKRFVSPTAHQAEKETEVVEEVGGFSQRHTESNSDLRRPQITPQICQPAKLDVSQFLSIRNHHSLAGSSASGSPKSATTVSARAGACPESSPEERSPFQAHLCGCWQNSELKVVGLRTLVSR